MHDIPSCDSPFIVDEQISRAPISRLAWVEETQRDLRVTLFPQAQPSHQVHLRSQPGGTPAWLTRIPLKLSDSCQARRLESTVLGNVGTVR